MDGYLILADGKTFRGHLNQSIDKVLCRVVFNTATVGHAELIQDPALADQGLVLTFPEVGNRGLTAREADRKPAVKALIVRQLYNGPVEDKKGEDWVAYCQRTGLPVLSGVDTRSLAAYIRENGIMNGLICSEHPTHFSDIRDEIISFKPVPPARQATASAIRRLGASENPTGALLALLDYGVAPAFVERLLEAGYQLALCPPTSAPEAVLSTKPRAILLSNGPDSFLEHEELASALTALLEEAQRHACPVIGLGLGHLLLAQAEGLRITPLEAGSSGGSRPVVRLADGKILQVVAHNYFAIDPDSLSEEEHVIFRHLNDELPMGISYADGLFKGYSFDPTLLVEPGVSESVTLTSFLEG